MSHAIDLFTVFDDRLSLSGWVETTGRLELRMDDGQIVAVETVRQDGVSRFHLRTAFSSPTPHHARLFVIEDGRPREIGPLVAPAPAHGLYPRFISMLQGEGRLLEIGSRARSGISRRDITPPGWSYTGLDVLPGENVDVVGDAHELSSIFPDQEFDAVMALSVLEHILMPWKLAIELNKVMRPGALGFFLTHQGWPLHDAPWDFWRFSDQSWRSIFNTATGFEIIDAQMGEPAFVVPQHIHAATAFGMGQSVCLASLVLFRKVSDTSLTWPVTVADITDTRYPEGTTVFVP